MGRIAVGLQDYHEMMRYDKQLRRATDNELGLDMPTDEDDSVQVGDNVVNHYKQGLPAWVPAAIGAMVPTVGLLGWLAYQGMQPADPVDNNTDTITVIGIE